MNGLEEGLVALIVGELNLEGIQLDVLTVGTPMCGEGFGLDPVDILKVALLISRKRGFELCSGNPSGQKIFASLGSLTACMAGHRV